MADEKRQDEVVNPAGMPEMHPPKGGPNEDPDVPDPEHLVPGRPGFPEKVERSDADRAEE
ncbi:hypothetical protein [Pseudonocardia asaccharolytica]|uniref:Uncharacterized protein n=1 Tax=Pseudonocardia asaccharolytica DSM 44247 = NBRC 16224 TaxID=1123024 RepID=A0A511CX33_9PSEU|nr:hypothetical protein [Pseudonocardia asaccharolytica]GEL17037.1 hypothetical protein PA7_08740 [Pseudonocardia asaccharolytica DSM 44247 = NBRC 16224]